MLQNKKILLGITGSIAAYKAAYLVRLLVRDGAEVQVIMTPAAKEFITPLTLATLSKNPVCSTFFEPRTGDWHSHVDLGIWADVFIIAPATANTIAKMATGQGDNLLLTTYLSSRCPVFLAPAMDTDMYMHPATKQNLAILKERGVHLIEPATGELASGLEGKGRMEEPENIFIVLNEFFGSSSKGTSKKKLLNKKVLITAGPTYEPIDPVRFIGNYSSGKMGYALAETFAEEGASVTLVSGPVSITPKHPAIKLINVQTATEMMQACLAEFPQSDIAILSAAVADFTPAAPSAVKIKRSGDFLTLKLQPTPDIAASLGKIKKTGQILIGFALETNDAILHATEKLTRKKFDFIVLNSLKDKGAGFGVDTNKVTFIDNKNQQQQFALKSKKEVARDILEKTITYL